MVVKVDRKGFQDKDVVMQEPSSPLLPLHAGVVGSPVEEEDVSLPIQNDQAKTLGDKVWTQSSQDFVNLDSDEEKDAGDGRIQGLIEELSLLKLQVKKWKGQVDIYQEGMIPLVQHRNTIRELRER